MKRLIVILISLMSIEYTAFSQTKQFDTTMVITSAKMRALLELDDQVRDKSFFMDFLDYKPDVRFLTSSGFDDVIFFEIIVKRYDDMNKIIRKDSDFTFYRSYFDNVIHPTVLLFGYNTINKDIYTLQSNSGWHKGELKKMFNYLKMHDSDQKNKLKDVTIFVEEYKIQDQNMHRMYKALKY